MLDFDDILIKLPSLKNLLDTHGSISLFDYAKKSYYAIPNESPLLKSRKQEFLNFLDGYVTRKFGKKSAEIVVDALLRNYAVSTAEHHGPMGHPFFFQSALLRAITQPDLPVINFATSHVSLGNSSYPRGLVFHGDGEKAPKEYIYLPFFGAKSRMCPVFALPAYTREDIEGHCIKRLQKYSREHIISEKMYESILVFIQQHILNPGVLALNTYSEQITQLNHTWWGGLFPEKPAYVSLDAEDLTVELLKKHLQEKTFFSQLLTDISMQPSIEVAFDGISCCFEYATRKGTYLFWYIDEYHRRHALWREGDELVSQEKNFRMKMTQDEYQYHLGQRHLIPSGLLVYTMFACYYGVTCFGGIFQDTYLSEMKRAFVRLSSDNYVGDVKTNIINADLYYLFTADNMSVSALDFILNTLRLTPLESIKGISLQQSIENCCADL